MSLANDSASILDAALALPLREREALVRKLVISLDTDQPKHAEYDRLWAEEIQRRSDALENGSDPGVDDAEARRRIHEAAQRGPNRELAMGFRCCKRSGRSCRILSAAQSQSGR